ncbi:alpha/beta fold hydrolase [Fervidobacterium thailandense]|uniref:AB hydrolase-1 domain-containing protein n=1 Tax=Fervidobacterium thailandense TaxID=1008305 RepID=A0A1E3G1R5_9BACT|nr:alpha/beta hydrolase [Fervidobacterium thailandense]ODN30197.1 hypothetical protein A4H02_06440 [Fervidobacterium thailandense]
MVARTLIFSALVSLLIAFLNVQGIKSSLQTELKYLEVNGIKVAYRDYKNPYAPDRVFVFLHGLGGSSVDWMLVVENVRKFGRCILIDVPPFGLSEKSRDFDYSDENTMELLLAFLDKLGIDRFNLIGHSMGGQLSLLIASAVPEKVEKLVLIAPAAFKIGTGKESSQIDYEHEENLLNGVNLSRSGTRLLATMLDGSLKFYPAFRFLYQGSKPRLEKVREKHLELTFVQNYFIPGEVWLKFTIDKIKQPPYHLDFSKINAETLIIFGTNDAIVSPKIGEFLSKRIKNSHLVLVDGGEHLLMFDQRCVALITEFLLSFSK